MDSRAWGDWPSISFRFSWCGWGGGGSAFVGCSGSEAVRLCMWWWGFMYTVVWCSLCSFECDLAQLCSQFSLPLCFLDLKKRIVILFFNELSIILPCLFGSCGNLNQPLSFFPLHLWRELGHTCVRALVFSLAFLVCSSVFLCWCALFFHSLDDSLWHSEVLN